MTLDSTNDVTFSDNTEPEDWLVTLTNSVLDSIQSLEDLSPAGCHVYFDQLELVWEVTLFLSSTVIEGRCEDEPRLRSRFFLDLNQILDLMEELEEFYWQALPITTEDELGSHVSLWGNYQGHRVWLRILSTPPEQFGPGRMIDLATDDIKDLW